MPNLPTRDKLKVWGMEYDLSKKYNFSALVHHIVSGIKIDGVFDVQSKSCFDSVDYCRSRMYFVIKKTYSPNVQHHDNWCMVQIYYQVSFVGPIILINPSSANMIVNGAVMSQLVTKPGKKARFGCDWTGGSVISLRYNGMLGGNFGLNFYQVDYSGFINMNFPQASSVDEVGASVTSFLPELNHYGLSFSKGAYPNST